MWRRFVSTLGVTTMADWAPSKVYYSLVGLCEAWWIWIYVLICMMYTVTQPSHRVKVGFAVDRSHFKDVRTVTLCIWFDFSFIWLSTAKNTSFRYFGLFLGRGVICGLYLTSSYSDGDWEVRITRRNHVTLIRYSIGFCSHVPFGTEALIKISLESRYIRVKTRPYSSGNPRSRICHYC